MDEFAEIKKGFGEPLHTKFFTKIVSPLPLLIVHNTFEIVN